MRRSHEMKPDPLASSFGPAAADYERGRPGYPAEAIDLLTTELGLGPGSSVVDLAAGTGKLTAALVERFERVRAIEPLAEMLAVLRERVPRAEAIEGSAETMPIPDASADAVFAAQAFHWFAGEPALTEIARVMRPGGGLGLLWNTSPWETREGPWFSALDDLLERSRADLTTVRRHASGAWMETFAGEHRFEPLSAAVCANSQRLPREDLIAALASRSYVAVLGKADRAELLGGIEAMLDRPDAPLEDGEIVIPMHTGVFWTRLR